MKTNTATLQTEYENQLRTEVIGIVRVLRDKGATVGFAESCTGGLLSSYFTELAGVSDVFMGSIISYDNKVKQNILKVSEETLKTQGAVSESTALQMAEGARQTLGVSYAVSVTGIAGPSGGSATKPVGTVFIAVSGLNTEAQAFGYRFEGDRKAVQLQSCLEAVRKLNGFIKG